MRCGLQPREPGDENVAFETFFHGWRVQKCHLGLFDFFVFFVYAFIFMQFKCSLSLLCPTPFCFLLNMVTQEPLLHQDSVLVTKALFQKSKV